MRWSRRSRFRTGEHRSAARRPGVAGIPHRGQLVVGEPAKARRVEVGVDEDHLAAGGVIARCDQRVPTEERGVEEHRPTGVEALLELGDAGGEARLVVVIAVNPPLVAERGHATQQVCEESDRVEGERGGGIVRAPHGARLDLARAVRVAEPGEHHRRRRRDAQVRLLAQVAQRNPGAVARLARRRRKARLADHADQVAGRRGLGLRLTRSRPQRHAGDEHTSPVDAAAAHLSRCPIRPRRTPSGCPRDHHTTIARPRTRLSGTNPQ